MTHSLNPMSKLSEVDVALDILLANEQPMYYKDLIEAVIQRLNLSQEVSRISAILTQINLDSRFAYIGQGEWGLKSWAPTRGTRRLPTITLMNKSVAYDDDADKDSLDENQDEMDVLDSDLPDLDDEDTESDGELDEDVEEDGDTWVD